MLRFRRALGTWAAADAASRNAAAQRWPVRRVCCRVRRAGGCHCVRGQQRVRVARFRRARAQHAAGAQGRGAFPPPSRAALRHTFTPQIQVNHIMWGCGRNSQKIASASDDWTVGLWDAASAGSLCRLTHHTAPVYGVAWSPDGACIASSSFDRSVVLWDIRTRKIVRSKLSSASLHVSSPSAPWYPLTRLFRRLVK